MKNKCANPDRSVRIGILLPPISGLAWELLLEGATIQPEGLWPEGWIVAPEGSNSHARPDMGGSSNIPFLIKLIY